MYYVDWVWYAWADRRRHHNEDKGIEERYIYYIIVNELHGDSFQRALLRNFIILPKIVEYLVSCLEVFVDAIDFGIVLIARVTSKEIR